ncbi:Rpp14 family [Metarhizium album ARSEF 1941]|uniref:Ribonuclease P/MRP protein subunit POP5 n=1 Tax=Metarhizium album (strain ARSEF 1941) TaxID=1081103 RepID=A0A0B2WV32_METAS|nr:Rpp14 family [Metarhizium album ARSEF 1941]KHN97938.1 Rpp14 family [Metarhizium album ARSEF 1941]
MVRIKERYLLANIIYPPDARQPTGAKVPDVVLRHQPTVERVTPQTLLRAIRDEVGLLFGDLGRGALEGTLSVKYLSLATSTFILRCRRAHYQMVWSALTCMDRVPANGGRPCIFRVVRVSGTIRKAEEEAIRQARQLILAAKDQASFGSQISQSLRLQQDESMLEVVDRDSDFDNAVNEHEG